MQDVLSVVSVLPYTTDSTSCHPYQMVTDIEIPEQGIQTPAAGIKKHCERTSYPFLWDMKRQPFGSVKDRM